MVNLMSNLQGFTYIFVKFTSCQICHEPKLCNVCLTTHITYNNSPVWHPLVQIMRNDKNFWHCTKLLNVGWLPLLNCHWFNAVIVMFLVTWRAHQSTKDRSRTWGVPGVKIHPTPVKRTSCDKDASAQSLSSRVIGLFIPAEIIV